MKNDTFNSRIDVDSSRISRIEYNSNKKILRVHFVRGGVYDYQEVPMSIFRKLTSTKESVGKSFQKLIINASTPYKYTKL